MAAKIVIQSVVLCVLLGAICNAASDQDDADMDQIASPSLGRLIVRQHNPTDRYYNRPVPGAEAGVEIDLRHTNCFGHPRQQGQCQAAYAISLISVIRYMTCMDYNWMAVDWSEQYIIDCGKLTYNGLNGCGGGNVEDAISFSHLFGIHTAENHLFIGQEGQCPFSAQNLNVDALYKLSTPNFITVDRRQWKHWLDARVPLIVQVMVSQEVANYRQGMINRCRTGGQWQPMVVVGYYTTGRGGSTVGYIVRHSLNLPGVDHITISNRSNCLNQNAIILDGFTDSSNGQLVNYNTQ